MYSVYINHFKRGNSTVNTEELMFAVPIINNANITRPIVKSNEDAADNFSFTMDSNSPYYDAILPYKTTIRVEYDGDVIFWGRALAPSTSTVLHTKTVQCEGSYAFFNDTYYEGVQEKFRTNITVSDYLTKVINNHNDMTPEKQIYRGEIGITLPTKEEKYEPTSWTQTTSILNDLTSNNGGHMRIRYTNGNAYLDWYKYYNRDLGDGQRPSVIIGKNILDISSEANNRNIFTRVIPIGSTNHDGKTIYIDGYKYRDKDDVEHTYSGKVMPVSFIRNLYTSSQLTDEFHNWTDYRDAESTYGIIYKTVSFPDATTQEKLFDEVKKWIKECYYTITSSFTVKAIDMHILDGNIPKILLGDCVDVTFLMTVNGTKQWVTKKLVCKAVQYDLYNPENNSYTFGIPSDLLNAASRHKSSKSASETTGKNNRATPKGTEDGNITWRKVWQMIGALTGDRDYEGTNAAMSFYNNGELSGTVYCIDPTEIETGSTAELNQKKFSAILIGKITLSGKSVKWVAVSNDRGIFAYVENHHVKSVSHWYSQKSGYKYEGSASGESTFDRIATLIEKDTNASWGGANAAASFRVNGKINGSVNKCYDINEHTAQEAQADPSLVFSAEIVGKFTLSGQNKYVAISKEYGIFGFNSSARGLIPATHWYEQVKGLSYDNTSAFISTENGDSFATDDGTPDGKKTIWFKPTELTGYGSEGTAVFGYDTTGTTDKWKVKLNAPIQYVDADGVTRVADGFVSASDFSVQEIPSFKTKIGIFDIVIAGKVEAQEISADLAEVRKWLGDVISAGTRITSAQGIFTNLTCTNITSGTYTHNHYDSGSLISRHLERCFYSFDFSESNGSITLTQYSLDGARQESHSFNMASTQFFQDAVEAAWNNGGATAYATTDTPTINPGDNIIVNAYYIDHDGNPQISTSDLRIYARPVTDLGIYDNSGEPVSSQTISSALTIKPRYQVNSSWVDGTAITITPEGSSISSDDISISNNFGTTATGRQLINMKNAILQAIDRGTYFNFTVSVDGTSASKTYWMDFR